MHNRVVVVCGPHLTHRNTCATLIRAGLNVVGVCVCDRRMLGIPFDYITRAIKRKGLGITLSRIAARTLYSMRNNRYDRAIFQRLFDEQIIDRTLHEWGGQIHRTHSYSASTTLAWLRNRKADIIVAHTPYWISKVIRTMPTAGVVLGGHTGLTPFYRGSHSAFWAIYSGKPQDVGCTVFVLNEGVDTGDIVAQRRISIEPGDSFITLGWKAMIHLANMQATIIGSLDSGSNMPRQSIDSVPANSEFDNPTLREYLHYSSRQQITR